MKLSQLQEEEYANTLVEHFDQITAEYEMKMDILGKLATSYSWNNVDEIVYFAFKNDMKVHGHTLIWYRLFPECFSF